MAEKMNVLFISPFENMRQTIRKIADLYPNIDTTIRAGNNEDGLRIALDSLDASFDCIISRGNTATLIRQAVSTPVVEVKTTLNDVLGSLSEVTVLPQIVGAVGYSNVLSGMDALRRFLPFELRIYGFDDIAQLESIFRELRGAGIQTIVCDTITCQMALAQGFDAYILRSGEDSIRYAFDYVNLLQQSNRSILEENQLLRRLASVNAEGETVVFSQAHQLYYSSLTQQEAAIFDCLQDRLADFRTTDRFKIIKQHAGYLYRITAKKVVVGGSTYYAYFISRRIPNIQNLHKGIRYAAEDEIQAEMDGSVFGIANLEAYYSQELNHALSLRNLVLIFGEVGVGKNHLAEMIYLNSQFTKNPFVFVDFTLINKQTWNFLIGHNDSPFCDSGNTLFLKNIDALDAQQITQLVAALIEGNVAKRNRILISCSSRRDQSTLPSVAKVIDQLFCITISMLPLRGKYGTIESSTNLLLSDYRSRHSCQVGNPDQEAMALLLHYDWPQNYNQLIRVISKVATLAGSGPITKDIVSEALTTEMLFTQGETELCANTFLDLTKPLSEINSDIIRILLEQNGGNQSQTAKSLGISRTTMWRMLKAQKASPGAAEGSFKGSIASL